MKNPLVQKLLFCAAAVLCGWIAAFSMAPVSCWPLLFVGISGLYWLYSKTIKPMQAWAAGFFFALGYFVTGLWWIGNALLVEGNDFAWVWPISVIGLPTLLGLFTATYLAIARILSQPGTLKGLFFFAFFLTVSEWTRGHAFTGFPWNLYGYTWADHMPMAQGFYLFGSFGMTLISLLWAATPGFAVVHAGPWKKKIRFALPVVISMALLCLWGQERLENNPVRFDAGTGIVVVQPNIAQTMKWDPVAVQDNFLKMNSLSKGAAFDDPQPRSVFVVWPETAIGPSIYTSRDNVDRMQKMLQGYAGQSYLLTGILQQDTTGPEVTFSNSIAFMNKKMEMLNLYSKTHLVPFGEFIPFQNWIPLKPVTAFRGFERGRGAETIQHANIPSFSPLICYEIIFPDNVISKYSASRPKWIVNVTNDGWYGKSAGPYQHFAQTRLRAIEEGLPVVRSANTGISGIIDPYGRVIERAELSEEASIVSLLPRNIEKPSPFWPWILQPLLFFTSIGLMLQGLFHLVSGRRPLI